MNPPAIKTGLDRKTAMNYARAFRAKGMNVYARKVRGGWSVFDKGQTEAHSQKSK